MPAWDQLRGAAAAPGRSARGEGRAGRGEAVHLGPGPGRAGGLPGLRRFSVRVHSRYQRRLADTAIGGRPVLIRLTVRRYFCPAADCPVTTFAEQVEGLTVRYARRTPPLAAMLTAVALALAGRAGARLAPLLGLLAGRSSMLRLVMALPDPQAGQVRVLGVDDF